MCLSVSKTAKARTAKEEIVCYKPLDRIDNKFFSGYRKFEYDLHILYKLGKLMKNQNGGVDEGFHSYKNLEDCFADQYECIIPKGSKYFTGKFGDRESYASDQIIIDKRIRCLSERGRKWIREMFGVINESNFDILKMAIKTNTDKQFEKNLKSLSENNLEDEVLYVKCVCMNNFDIKTTDTFIEWATKNAEHIISS